MAPKRWLKVLSRHPVFFSFTSAMVLWCVLSVIQVLGKTLIASPHEVAEVLFGQTAGTSDVWRSALYTFARALAGWILSILVGSVIGGVVGRVRPLYLGSEPILEFTRSVPPVILFPLFLVIFNYSLEAYIVTIVVGCVPVMALAVARRLQRVAIAKIELLDLYNVPKPMRALAIGMEALPGVFLGARITLSIAIVIAVVSEMVIAPNTRWAIGSLAEDSLMSFDTPTYFAATFLVGMLGYISNAMLRLLERSINGTAGSDGFG